MIYKSCCSCHLLGACECFRGSHLSLCVHTWQTGCSYTAISWRSATLSLHLAQLSRAYLNARCPGMVDARPAHSGRVMWEVPSTITTWIFSRQERSSPGPTNLLWDFNPMSLYKVALLWQFKTIAPLLQSELFSPHQPWVFFQIPFNKHVGMYLVVDPFSREIVLLNTPHYNLEIQVDQGFVRSTDYQIWECDITW